MENVFIVKKDIQKIEMVDVNKCNNQNVKIINSIQLMLIMQLHQVIIEKLLIISNLMDKVVKIVIVNIF